MLIILYNQLFIMSIVAGGLYLVLKLISVVTVKYFIASWHYYTYIAIYLFLLLPYHKLILLFHLNYNHQAGNDLNFPTLHSIIRIPTSDNNDLIAVADKTEIAPLLNFDFLPCILISGTIVFILIVSVQNYKLYHRIFSVCRLTDKAQTLEALSRCKQKMGISKNILVYISPYASTPFMHGIFKPCIVLPEAEFTAEELQCIFCHELTHWKRHDAWLKCMMLFVNAVHWYNPLAYIVRRDIDSFCELSCDESIVISMNNYERRQYCELLLGVLWNAADQHAKIFSAFSDKQQLERRINTIMKIGELKNKKWVRLFAVAMTLTFLLTGAVIAYAASSEDAIDVDTSFVQPTEKEAAIEWEDIPSSHVNVTENGLNLSTTEVGPMSTLYLKDKKISGNSATNYTSPTGNAFDLVEGRKVYYDLTWFPRNTLKIGLYDVDAGEVKNMKTIKNGSATGSIKVPADGLYYFYVWNTEDDQITLNGTIDP